MPFTISPLRQIQAHAEETQALIWDAEDALHYGDVRRAKEACQAARLQARVVTLRLQQEHKRTA